MASRGPLHGPERGPRRGEIAHTHLFTVSGGLVALLEASGIPVKMPGSTPGTSNLASRGPLHGPRGARDEETLSTTHCLPFRVVWTPSWSPLGALLELAGTSWEYPWDLFISMCRAPQGPIPATRRTSIATPYLSHTSTTIIMVIVIYTYGAHTVWDPHGGPTMDTRTPTSATRRGSNTSARTTNVRTGEHPRVQRERGQIHQSAQYICVQAQSATGAACMPQLPAKGATGAARMPQITAFPLLKLPLEGPALSLAIAWVVTRMV